MKKRVIRALCGILAMQIVLSNGAFVSKAEEAENSADNEDVVSDLAEAAVAEARDGSDAETEYTSALEVKIMHASVLDRTQEFKVYLKNKDVDKTVQLDPQKEDYITTEFSGLEARTYVLRIESAGYASYEQKIQINKGYNYSISVATGECGIPGVGFMPYGDLDGDGTVDKTDVSAVVDAIEAEAMRCRVMWTVTEW